MGVAEQGFTRATPIQAQTLPDRPCRAGMSPVKRRPGTGKTAAFLIALFNRLLTGPAAHQPSRPMRRVAIIIAPTRELAVQIHSDAAGYRLNTPV